MADESSDIAVWSRLLEPDTQAMLDELAGPGEVDVATMSRWRKKFDRALVAAACDYARARRKMSRKLAARDRNIVADPMGLEQASSSAAASYKASRLRALVDLGQPVLDACSGIGIDARYLVDAGFDVTGIDQDALKAWMTSINARCQTHQVNAISHPPTGCVVHVDPDRRSAGQRSRLLEDMSPAWGELVGWVRQARGACIKLSPGTDASLVREAFPQATIEWLSEDKALTQLLVWTGCLAQADYRATVICRDDSLVSASFAAEKILPLPQTTTLLTYVYEADPALERSRLLGNLADQYGLAEPALNLGLVTGDGLIHDTWLTRFKVLARLPWREALVKTKLRELGGGIVEVKTRDQCVNPDIVQKDLRGEGKNMMTVFVLRVGSQREAWITKRESDAQAKTLSGL